MAKSRLVTSAGVGTTLTNILEMYLPVGTGSVIDVTTSHIETDRQTIHRTAGTFSNFYVRLQTNTHNVARTWRFRNNAVNGNLVMTITASTPGVYEDTTHTDTIAAGDKPMTYVQLASTGGFNLAVNVVALTFDATSGTSTRCICNMHQTSASWSPVKYQPLTGPMYASTAVAESVVKARMRKAGVFKNMCFKLINGSPSGTHHCRLRQNAADTSLDATWTGNGTGWFEDTTNTVTVAAGDDCDLAPLMSSATAVAVGGIAVDFTDTSAGYSLCAAQVAAAVVINVNLTRYQAVSGKVSVNATENNVKCLAKDTYVASQLTITLSANTVSASSTIRFRDSGASGTQVATITASTAGTYSDTTNSDSIAATDDINYMITTGATGTSISVTAITMAMTNQASQNLTRAPNAETITIADSSLTAVKTVVCVPTAEDTMISDASLTALETYARVPSVDTTTVTAGTATRTTQAFRVPSTDTISISDSSLTRMKTAVSIPSADSTTVSDVSLTRMLSDVRSPSSDTTISGESITRNTQAFRTVPQDTTTITDASLQRVKTLPRVPSADSTIVSDSSLTRLLSSVRIPSADTVSIVDSSLVRSRSLLRIPLADTTTVIDVTLTIGRQLSRLPLADSTTVVDFSLSRLLSVARGPSADTVLISDSSLSRMLSALRLLSVEVISSSESVDSLKTVAGINYTRSPALDAVSVVDGSISRLLSRLRLPSTDTISIIESSLSRATQLFRMPSADTSSVVDASLDRVTSKSRLTAPENTPISDSLSRLLSAQRTPSQDSIPILDFSLTRMLQFARLPSLESITLSENLNRIHTTAGQFNRSVSDTVAIQESLSRLLTLNRVSSLDSLAVSELLSGGRLFSKAPVLESINITDALLSRSLTTTRSPTSDSIIGTDASLVRLLSAFRSPTADTTSISELQSLISFSRSLQETIGVTEPLLQRIVYVARTITDSVAVGESVFYETYKRLVFDSVIVAEQLFSERELLSGPTTYATPAEVRPLLGNLADQRTDAEINLAVAAAYDQINRKTNRLPPNDWTEADADWDIIKKLARYIAALEMSIGIKDFQDRELMEKEIDYMYNLITENTPGDSTTDIVESSGPETYASNPTGVIWSQRYPNLKKTSSGKDNQQYSSVYD